MGEGRVDTRIASGGPLGTTGADSPSLAAAAIGLASSPDSLRRLGSEARGRRASRIRAGGPRRYTLLFLQTLR